MNRSPPSNAEVKNEWSYASITSVIPSWRGKEKSQAMYSGYENLIRRNTEYVLWTRAVVT